MDFQIKSFKIINQLDRADNTVIIKASKLHILLGFREIIHNAVKAMKSCNDSNKIIRFEIYEEQEKIQVSVLNTGNNKIIYNPTSLGIGSQVIENIFGKGNVFHGPIEKVEHDEMFDYEWRITMPKVPF